MITIYGMPKGSTSSGWYDKEEEAVMRGEVEKYGGLCQVREDKYGFQLEPCPPEYGWYALPGNLLEEFMSSSQNPHLEPFKEFPILSMDVEVLGEIKPDYKEVSLLVKGVIRGREKFFFAERTFCFREDKDDLLAVSRRLFPAPVIAEGAQRLFLDLKSSDSGDLAGLTVEDLVAIREVKSRKEILKGKGSGGYSGDAITQIECVAGDGSSLTLFEKSRGYFEGYTMELYNSKSEAWKALYSDLRSRAKADWVALECWECGATYAEPGHVEPGQMGCDRCN